MLRTPTSYLCRQGGNRDKERRAYRRRYEGPAGTINIVRRVLELKTI